MNIFDKSKIHCLHDPVFLKKQINKINKINKKNNMINDYKYILNIGRLTKQKNQVLLIKSFKEISKQFKKLKLIILGEGEKYDEIKNLIINLNLENKVKLLGHTKNTYEYINRSVCLIVSSLWEDPGFVMIEASALKKTVISSDCPSGPKEFFDNGRTGFLFQNNSVGSLVNNFNRFMNTKKNKINFYIRQNYKKSLDYSEIAHAKNFKKLINKYEKR